MSETRVSVTGTSIAATELEPKSKRETEFNDSDSAAAKKKPKLVEEEVEKPKATSQPKEESEFEIEANAAEDKGSRHSMEDAWVVLPDTRLEALRCVHFAVYDGHGGRLAAEYAQKNLHANVLSAGLPRELFNVKAAKKAIVDGFKKTDESLLQQSASGGWQDGATAVCVWVLGRTVS